MKRRLAAVLAAPVLLLAIEFSGVRPTNFSGWDEWLLVSLSSRGIVSIPYANRPLVLLWAVPGALLVPHDLLGYFLAHAAYLAATGVFTALLALRLVPRRPLAALTAGVLAAVWAPLDWMRLDTVLLTGYSGFTAAAMAATVLFVEGWVRGRRLIAFLGGAVAAITVLGFEGTLPLLAAAPLLPLAIEAGGAAAAQRRRWIQWAVAWESLLAAAALPLAVSLLRPGSGSYQASALGMDLHPFRFAVRLLMQYRFHLWPLLTTSPSELARPLVAVAVAAFLLVFLAAAWRATLDDGPRADLLRFMATGLALAGLGWLALCASPAIRTPARTQVLSAPGVGLFLAGIVALLGALVSRPALRAAVLALGGAWVVAVGTGRTVAMQAEWDRTSYWPAQSATLRQLSAAAGAMRPGTLVVLLDEADAFPATFTFRHALGYLYGTDVVGYVWQAHDFLYPARFLPDGVHVDPWPAIRGPWREAPTRHGYGEIVAARLSPQGRLQLLDAWPAELPPLPPGALYAPRLRLLPQPPPPSHRILRRQG